jgi:tetratricopeptide (TPR) repeat protein
MHKRSFHFVLLRVIAMGLCALVGCAHARPETGLHMDPIVFVAGKDGTVSVHDPAEPFAAASAAYQENRYADALALFDRVVAEHPGTQHARSALYNAGLCLEQLDRRVEATARFRKLADDYADSPEALDALFRLGANLVLLKDWVVSEEVHARILKRAGLTLSDQVEAYARLGEARFERGRYEDAERTLRQLRELYRQHEQEERLDTDYFLAMGTFYLAEVAHAQYRLLPVRLPQKRLEDDLEAKARMLLLAQARYVDAMRVRHAEWATAAGFRIGSLYREFYDDLVGAPIPEQLQGEAREVYQDEVKKKVRTLLEKAVAFHEKNVLMAERTGEKNDWVRRSNAQLEELRRLLEPGTATPTSVEAPPPEPPHPLPPPRDLGGGRTTL